MPLLVALAAAGDGQLDLLVQLVQQGELRGAVGAVGLAFQVDMRGEDRHVAPSKTGAGPASPRACQSSAQGGAPRPVRRNSAARTWRRCRPRPPGAPGVPPVRQSPRGPSLIVTHHSLATLAPGCKTGKMTAQATSARGGARGAPGRPARRRRDPERKERILVAAAALGARRGFDAISLADIGAEAGIVGSGVYRHFDSKTAILVAMADRVMDRLMTRSAAIIAAGLDEGQTLTLLVRDHIEVALTHRDALAVYHREVRT